MSCIVVMGRDRSKRGLIPQARAPRANVEVHLANNDILRNPLCMRQCQCPTGLPDRFGLWQSFSGRSGFSKSSRRCQLRCSRRQGVHIRIHTGARTPVARLQVGARSEYVSNSPHLRSLSAPLSHLRKLTGLGLTGTTR